MERNNVVLVNDDDSAIAVMEKLEAHRKGLLHRAFSIFIFNSQDEMLLQQRAGNKYHGGGLWTNACCSHPQWGEDIKQSAAQRLQYEMGISCDLEHLFKFTYRATVENNLIEHELDYIFAGYTDATPSINIGEVQNYRWIRPETLILELQSQPEIFTAWFKVLAGRVIAEFQRKKKVRDT
ncbi:MAG TPA: isopentenyl-diphosphate Delta-isomerase [Chryseolinea sp.]